jgi:hypothetical protein
MNLLRKKPKPDFAEFRRVLTGEKRVEKVYLVELFFNIKSNYPCSRTGNSR